jgi:copper chaperone CopZ
MTCASCPYIVNSSMAAVPGVTKVVVSFEAKTATVTFDDGKTNPDAIAAASTNAATRPTLRSREADLLQGRDSQGRHEAMNGCCASSSSLAKPAASASAALPSYSVRPGVTFPDWSVVTSPRVRDALRAMVGSDHSLNRWSGYDSATDRVRIALLQLYAEGGRAPTLGAIAMRAGLSETAVPPLLEELRRRDIAVFDGERIVGAYPFTDRDTGHRVDLDGRMLNAMCAVDALGIGAMYHRDLAVASRCRHCGGRSASPRKTAAGHWQASNRGRPWCG